MRTVHLYIIVAGAVLLAYWTSFPGAFHFDDFALLLENPRVTDAPFDYRMFLEQYGGRPLTLWTFHLNLLWGGASPFGFHLVSVVLHALASLLIMNLLLRWGLGDKVAFSAALIFAVHPALAQPVNYIWARSIVLMTVLGLSALLAVRWGTVPALILWQLAIFSRVEGLLFLIPLAMLRVRLWKAGLVLAGCNVAAFLYGFARHSPAEFAFSHSSWLEYWYQAPASLWRYFELLVFPRDFSVYRGATQVGPLGFAIALGALLALVWALIRMRATHPHLTLASGWILLFLTPSVLTPNTEGVSESRLYAAAVGFSVVAALVLTFLGDWARRRWSSFHRFPVAWMPCLAASILAGGLTVARHDVWADDVALWREAVERNPLLSLPRYNLGVALSRVGANPEACEQFEIGVQLNPEDDMSYAGLGFCAEAEGRNGEARTFYEAALAVNPGNDYARDGLNRMAAKAEGVIRP